MRVVTINRHHIAENNRSGWSDPRPTIRVAATTAGKAVSYASVIEIVDKNGETVATLLQSANGEPIVRCGAKVALLTNHDVRIKEPL